jgi:hypothetical protein
MIDIGLLLKEIYIPISSFQALQLPLWSLMLISLRPTEQFCCVQEAYTSWHMYIDISPLSRNFLKIPHIGKQANGYQY